MDWIELAFGLFTNSMNFEYERSVESSQSADMENRAATRTKTDMNGSVKVSLKQ
jgi:hypothetical protein